MNFSQTKKIFLFQKFLKICLTISALDAIHPYKWTVKILS